MNDDSELLRAQRAFLFEAEKAIRSANQKIIHEKLPELSPDTVHSLARAVARMRANYLESALDLIIVEGALPDRTRIENLRDKREMFEEARSAFMALQRAIELGYIDLGQSG